MAFGSAYAKEFDLFADETTRPADYREKLVEIHDLTQKAIVYLGMPTMALMGDLDDAIDFGYSDYWEQPRNTSVEASFTCWGTGGYDVTLTRSDFRKYTGTLTASNCGSFGYVINGTVSFEYDDTVWSTDFRFRDDFPLVFSFTNVQIRGGDGNLYTYTGKMQCDKKFNNASYYLYMDEAGIITELTYNLVESNGIPVHSEGDLLFEADGSMSKSTLIDNYNCDFSDVAVTTQGQTHRINGIKFVSEYWTGPDTDPSVDLAFSGGVGITTGRQERLSQIENEQYSLANKVTRSYFTHAEYGDYHFTNDAWPRYRSSSGGQGVWVEFTDDGVTIEVVAQLDGFRFKPWSHAEMNRPGFVGG